MYDDRRVSPGGAPPFVWTNDQGQTEAHYRAHHPEIATFRQRLYEREMHVSSLWPNLSPELLSCFLQRGGGVYIYLGAIVNFQTCHISENQAIEQVSAIVPIAPM